MRPTEENLRPGTRVRLVNDPLRTGVLTNAKPKMRKGRCLFQVRFPDRTELVYEDQLELQPEEQMDPLDLLEKGKLGTPDNLRRTLTHVRLTGRLADIIYSMEATNTDFYAYQFKPVLKLLQTPTNGLLIADEVGLGKTIEAGLIWTELKSRFDLNRLVVLCPAALREKWRDELSGKMGLSPIICDPEETLRTLRSSEDQTRGFTIIASTQGLRPPRHQDDPNETKSNTAELARFLRSMENEERLVDLLVIDEAHHMRNPETQTNRLGQLMRNVSEYLVLLTATPIHNHSRDIFSLLQLLDPDTFERQEDFVEILKANEPLVRARDLVLGGEAGPQELISLLREAKRNRILEGNRQLETLLEGIDDRKLDSLSERSQIAYRLETINLLGHAVTRTRKRDVQEWRIVRDPKPEFIFMTEVERKFYKAVTDIVIDYCLERGVNEAFLLVTPQRQMASCMPAALKTWEKRRVEISQDEFSSTDEDEHRQQLGPLTEKLVAHVAHSDDIAGFDALVENDSKYKRLHEVLQEFFTAHPKDKIIVFSTFRATLAHLQERLSEDGFQSIILQGGGNRTKDDIIREFRSSNGPPVLLSSEVGSEGVDLQFSRVVINYDLPWNPMQVEQRIGRIDRIGQKADKVLIWNLFYAETVDARIYECLYDKLDLCRSALGDFEEILGKEVKRLVHDLFTDHLTPAQQEDRIAQTALALETKKQEEERLESEAAHLVAYGDYILRQVQAAKETNRWIDGDDLFSYVTDFLNIHYPGCRLLKTDGENENHEYQLSLTTQAKHDLSEFARQKHLTGQTRLTQSTSSPVVCRFENLVRPETRTRKEIISQFHPLVRFISEKISETAEQTRPAVAVRIAAGDFETGIYVLVASLWSVQGLRDIEKLVYEAVHLERPDKLLGELQAERMASLCAFKGNRWLEARSQCDLNRAYDIANDTLGELDKRFERFVKEEEAQNADRADIQERNLDRHVSKQRGVIQRTINRLRETGRTQLIPANEGRLRALEERYELQKSEINKHRKVKHRCEAIFVALVLIE